MTTHTRQTRAANNVATTPDSHDFPTRPYDLVKEFAIALVVVIVLTGALAAIFSSPDEKSITMSGWAKAAPNDVSATATAELAGTSASATYGAPYNTNSDGQKLGPLSLQKWAGVRLPVDSAGLVLGPLSGVSGDAALTSAMTTWKGATADQQIKWATDYADALSKAPDGDPAKVAAADYGPVPAMTAGAVASKRVYLGAAGSATSAEPGVGAGAGAPATGVVAATVIEPVIPAAAWPGMEQRKVIPPVGMVTVPVALLAPAAEITVPSAKVTLWTVEPVFLKSTS